ncbi:MAG: hypothetical protein HQK54_04065 [Oligoflexales bacterium]|nr:hypothetical protein [Oligoflexales bacterium]
MNTNTDPNLQPNSMDSEFNDPSRRSSKANPFTGDLKGEFTSDFGTNTNAVSQIFKNNGLGGEGRTRTILIGVGILIILLGVLYYVMDSGDEEFKDEDLAQTSEEGDKAAQEEEEDSAGQQEAQQATTQQPQADASSAKAPAAAGAAATAQSPAAAGGSSTGPISVVQPTKGASHNYDETQGPAVFEWNGKADRIVFSRSPSMKPVSRIINLNGASKYKFDHPHPGTWYFRVENSEGASDVINFTVNPPVKRNIKVQQPTAGGTISGNGGVVTWEPDAKVARYQVQLVTAGSSWANAPYRFGTSGTSVAIKNVPAGSYDLRVGAFSEVSGRWEWNVISGVKVE